MAAEEERPAWLNGSELLLQLGGPFPWRGTYLGLPVVTIPAAEYEALAGRKGSSRSERGRQSVPYIRVTRWDRDPELARFVRERVGKVPQSVILAEAVERFGEARAPSRSALSRFAVACRLDRHKSLRGCRCRVPKSQRLQPPLKRFDPAHSGAASDAM